MVAQLTVKSVIGKRTLIPTSKAGSKTDLLFLYPNFTLHGELLFDDLKVCVLADLNQLT